MKPAVLILLVGLVGCDGAGEAERARSLIDGYGCGTCHRIPGTPVAGGRTGPPLTAMADQAYVAGVAPNTPEALAAFIADPQEVDPRSAMPDLDVTPEEARVLAAYLYAVSGGR